MTHYPIPVVLDLELPPHARPRLRPQRQLARRDEAGREELGLARVAADPNAARDRGVDGVG